MKTIRAITLMTLFGSALILTASLAWAHGDEHLDPNMKVDNPIAAQETPYGRQGLPRDAVRTIDVSLNDPARYAPDLITVKTGDTVRLRLINTGRQTHEFVLGTEESLTQHAAMMMQMPDMLHADPNVMRVDAGKTGELVWQFTRTGSFFYACLMPGHRQAGMQGRVVVLPADSSTP